MLNLFLGRVGFAVFLLIHLVGGRPALFRLLRGANTSKNVGMSVCDMCYKLFILAFINQRMNEQKPVCFEAAIHKDKAVIKIVFDYDNALAARAKALPGVRWSRTMKCWYVPDTEAYRARFGMVVKTAPAAVVQKLCPENEAALSFL